MNHGSRSNVFAITNVRLYGGELVTIGVRKGRITYIGERQDDPYVIDGQGHVAIPGGIDGHVHFRTPGETHKEDWEHAVRAALAGGITTICDQANNAEGHTVTTAEAFARKVKA